MHATQTHKGRSGIQSPMREQHTNTTTQPDLTVILHAADCAAKCSSPKSRCFANAAVPVQPLPAVSAFNHFLACSLCHQTLAGRRAFASTLPTQLCLDPSRCSNHGSTGGCCRQNCRDESHLHFFQSSLLPADGRNQELCECTHSTDQIAMLQ